MSYDEESEFKEGFEEDDAEHLDLDGDGMPDFELEDEDPDKDR